LPIAYLTNWSSQAPRKSENGKTLVKTAWRPDSSRSSGSRFICRKRSYERRCTSIRFGRSMNERIFEKFFLSGETATSVIQAPRRPGGQACRERISKKKPRAGGGKLGRHIP
jgi:hypothetical protein